MGAAIITKRVLLGVSGGIAAYKAAELVRLLMKRECETRVVMTETATQFIGQMTFQALTGSPVLCGTGDTDAENAMSHIRLARWADALLIAPATANCIAKLSCGIADDLLSTLYLATTCPVYVAPAMNQAMWAKAVTQTNIKTLQQHGVTIIGPDAGEQACGDMGFGRMAEPETIVERILDNPITPLSGKSLLVTAGPTLEPIDPVRYISNRSSGKMGYAVAKAAIDAGAKVTLISGPCHLSPHPSVQVIGVETAAQMHQAVMANVGDYDIFIGAAAVADYSPLSAEPEKIKKTEGRMHLVLQKTPDILAEVANLKTRRPFTVGFAAETKDLETYAKTKLQKKNLDMIAANWVGKERGGFDSDENALHVYWHGGERQFEMMAKNRLAEQFMALIAKIFHEKNST